MFSKPFQRYLHLKYLILKNQVKPTEYNIRNGPIRWQITTCIKVIPEHFFVSCYSFPDIHISNFVTLKMQVKVIMDSFRSGAIGLQISYFLSDGNSNVCIFRAFTCQNSQMTSLTLKILRKVKENNIRNGPVRCQMSTYINFILQHFSLALTVFEILIFEIFDLE